ncbi:MAG: hypothetical protein K6G48_03050 [Acholeplasmatales bacterium]|nr:hypothetical protein [Acholeplasmatales bacterium]
MMKFFKSLKARHLFILAGIMVVVDILLIIGLMHFNNRKAAMVILVICFLITGSLLNSAIFRVFAAKKAKCNTRVHSFKGVDFMQESLKDFTINEDEYGTIYSKVIDKCAYKVTFVKDYSKYNIEENKNKNYKKTPGIDDAKWMIAFEIFTELNDDLERKLPLYSMSGEKLFYEALYIDGDKIVEADFVEPYTYLVEKYNKLCEMVGIYDEEENTNL